jgi:DNA-binding CsgD family transcriptional regulator
MNSFENAAKVGSLNETQRAYLRLVAQGMTSKQIALAVHGSHHTVNAEIGIAMRLLGAKTRHEAAAMVGYADISSSYEPSYEPAALAVPPREAAGSDEDEGDETDAGTGWALPVATRKRPINTLTTGQRIGWVLIIAALVALLLGGLVSGIATILVSLHRLM